jgi:lysophospholipase
MIKWLIYKLSRLINETMDAIKSGHQGFFILFFLSQPIWAQSYQQQIKTYITLAPRAPQEKLYSHSFFVQKKGPTAEAFVFVQGRNEFTGMYEHTAQSFYDRYQLDFHLFDLRGQGRSSGNRCHIDSFQDYVLDLKDYILYLKKNYQYTSIHLVAHSTGSLVATFMEAQFPELLGKKGSLVLTSPLFGIKIPSLLKLITQGLSSLMSKSHFTSTLAAKKNSCPTFEENDLTNDPYFYKHYFQHELKCGAPTWGWVHSIMNALEELPKNIELLKHPVLIIYSKDDQVVDPEETNRVIRMIQSRKSPLLMEEGLEGTKHVLFHDKKRQKIYKRIQTFYQDLSQLSGKKK